MKLIIPKIEKTILGKRIHRLLNLTLGRKLTQTEYTKLILAIALLFDQIKTK